MEGDDTTSPVIREVSSLTPHVQRMLEVIEQSYADRITLDTLGATLNRQSAYLGQLFRKELGITVHQALTRVRLDHAARLIGEGVKIEAVALIVGYRSKKNFYRQFRRRFNTTPQQYARSLPGRETSRIHEPAQMPVGTTLAS
jgi:transcriptional regulator GlxA family with amidase domain